MESKISSARKPKTIFSINTPYTQVQWPVVSADNQTKILDMLCSLLSPIGEHRSRNIAPSKGKRAKKRKKKNNAIIQNRSVDVSEPRASETDALAPPGIHNHLTVGFNATTRYLALLAQNASRSTNEHETSGAISAIKTSARTSPNLAKIKPLAVIFVLRSGQPPVLYSHLPLATRIASLAQPSSPSTRIISLPKGAEDQLKAALGIHRVGIVGLMDGEPNASSLIEVVRQNVPELEVPWLQEAVKGAYLPVKINAIQTSAPLSPKKSARTSTSAMAPAD